MACALCTGQPAITTFIPPSVDSIILDYQSPNAQPGYYPNEDPNSGGVGEAHHARCIGEMPDIQNQP